MSGGTRVYLEIGPRRTFASAAGWPGWCRPGKTEQAALEALAAYASRYAKVAKLAAVKLPANATDFEVVERLKGNATTDFGAPGIPAQDERRPMSSPEAKRMRDLVVACWAHLDRVVETAPNALRKGPRGGGRDRDPMFDHVLGAETEYAKGIGIRLKQPDGRDGPAVRAFREAILGRMARPDPEARWPVPYAARRMAWHSLDHAWEIEDRIP
jgi:hypothetical protein